ncbi:hypothetical protein ASF10_20045 [Flavobacterium sp. Leaf82]|uniref:hypothetical protein n=1 Tax=unclassified Flavobacterium TaxID=196869 RepID=UPI0006F84D99|nr:hypothetical protein [Flavobacterium sp. Leaf82]KQO32751.1 hypothetical protein ASF10_20045 [Flavobacterium sp. Leaf82]
MKKLIFFLCIATKIFSQTHELKYQCHTDMNDEKYNLIQQFDEKRYSYTVEKVFDESIYSNESKVSLTICLNPETLNTEKIISKNKDYFFSELDYYKNITTDGNYNLDVEFISNNNIKEIELDINGERSKQKISEYILQTKLDKKALYKVWFLENLFLTHNMPYNKKQLMPDWTIIYYAFKNSKINKLIYSVEQIGKDQGGLKDTSVIKCKLLYFRDINSIECKE